MFRLRRRITHLFRRPRVYRLFQRKRRSWMPSGYRARFRYRPCKILGWPILHCKIRDTKVRLCKTPDFRAHPCKTPDFRAHPCKTPGFRVRPCKTLDSKARPCKMRDSRALRSKIQNSRVLHLTPDYKICRSETLACAIRVRRWILRRDQVAWMYYRQYLKTLAFSRHKNPKRHITLHPVWECLV
jgi:hypothetical protein